MIHTEYRQIPLNCAKMWIYAGYEISGDPNQYKQFMFVGSSDEITPSCCFLVKNCCFSSVPECRNRKGDVQIRSSSLFYQEWILSILRYSFALRMWVELGDIYLVKRLLGHSTVRTTEIYTTFRPDYLEQIFDQRANDRVERRLIGVA